MLAGSSNFLIYRSIFTTFLATRIYFLMLYQDSTLMGLGDLLPRPLDLLDEDGTVRNIDYAVAGDDYVRLIREEVGAS